MSKSLISVDPGNGFTKAKSRNRDVTFPSVVGREQGAIVFDTGLKARESLDHIVIEFDNERWAIGNAAYTSSRMETLEMGPDRIGGQTWRNCVAGALALTIRNSRSIALIASVPVEWYNGGKEKARQSLAGVWKITYQDQTFTYHLAAEDTHIVPEGFGAICSLALNASGGGANAELAESRVGVVDIGTRTTDLLRFDGLVLNQAGSTGVDNVGMFTIWRMVNEQISLKYGRTLKPHEIDRCLANGYFKQAGARIDITDEIGRANEALAQAVRAQINSLWSGGNEVDHLILTGGGADAIFNLLNYPHQLAIDKAWFANCEGAFRFGLRRGFADD